jgi:formylglycine-generating enzyme required for sulfatase activity
MFTFISPFFRSLFISTLGLLVMTACGVDVNSPVSRSNGTGSYVAGLSFPDDIPLADTVTNALSGINCAANGIAVIRFAFFDATDTHLVDDQFPCSDHQATVAGIPAGNNRRVVVTAEDQNGAVLLRGEEWNITIRKDRVTEGGDIAMTTVSSGDQGDDDQGDETSPPDSSDSFSNDLGMTFNLISAGTFMMGSPATELGRQADEIQHEVTLTQAFYMQTTEVTQGQWQAVMGQNPSRFQNCGPNCPVESVSWSDIQEFLTRINAQSADGHTYRLPTEAEWEYAARAGSEAAFCDGDITAPEGIDPILNTVGWYANNSDANYSGCFELDDGRCVGPQPVGSKTPNAFGLYDMHGNVWEWCSDLYGNYPSGSVTDPTGPSSGVIRVLRGGSWHYGAGDCRLANRGRIEPGYRGRSGGFRLTVSLYSR